jgi:hypothetical protein
VGSAARIRLGRACSGAIALARSLRQPAV